jgi:hypothetical protein
MSQFDPATGAALAAPVVTVFGAIEIVLNSGHMLRVLNSGGFVDFPDGRRFTGGDPVFGSISKVESLADGVGDEAPALKITFNPSSDAAAATLSAASNQESPVTMWTGVVDPQTGRIVGEALPFFAGSLDTTTIKSGAKSRTLEMVISSVFEDFFYNDDGARLSDTFHKSCWPNERGLAFVTYVVHQIYWGTDAPSGVST